MDNAFPSRVIVRYREHANTVRYARDLARLLSVPLLAHVPISMEETARHADRIGTTPGHLRIMMHTRMGADISKDTTSHDRHIGTEIGSVISRSGDIEVSCDTSSPVTLPRISPAGEMHVFRGDERGPIFIPLGDGPSGLIGAQYGLRLAKLLKVPALFWHTTWRNDAISEVEPIAHMCDEARAVLKSAELLAMNAEVEASCTIECAPRLVEGLVLAALRMNATLIVMAEGAHKRFGTYTERVRARNCPVPLLIVPKESA